MPALLLPLEHRQQEVEAGCLAACAQMALLWLGINVSQTELNHLFELTPAGVPLSYLTRLTRYGVQVTIKRHSDLETLLNSLDQSIPPITFIRTHQLSYWDEDTQHALIVSGYDQTDLFLHDPAFPDAAKRVSAAEFMLAWDEFDNTFAQIT